MANARTTGTNYKQATVDTAPGADGYACAAVDIRNEIKPRSYMKGATKSAFFYIKSIATDATIHLQWQHDDDDATWYDYDEDGYTAVGVHKIDNSSINVNWRAIVKNGNGGTGTSIFGISW